MPLAPVTKLIDRGVVADAGDDILQDAPARLVEQDVIGDDRRHAHRSGEVRKLVEARVGRSAAGAE